MASVLYKDGKSERFDISEMYQRISNEGWSTENPALKPVAEVEAPVVVAAITDAPVEVTVMDTEVKTTAKSKKTAKK